MANPRVRASKALENGLDLNLTAIQRQPDGGGFTGSIDGWQFVALYGILEELKKLNAVFACHNAQDIPNILRRIDKNTKKRPRAKKKAVKS
jgi:hypothetical protein